jgi:carboxymethylenebutenolidase
VEGKMISLEPKGGRIEAYLAHPPDAKRHPGVVLVHDWWGLNDQIKGVAGRLAGEGYVVIVPDLYRGKVGTDAGWAHQLSRGLDERWAVETIGAAIDWLRLLDAREGGRPAGDALPMAIWGIGMGGKLSLQTALAGKDLQAAVMFYSEVEPDSQKLKPLKAPLLGIFADEDHGIPSDKVKAFEAALKEAGKDSTIIIYRSVGHGFFNEKRPNFEKTAAKMAWERTLQFLQEKLGTPAQRAPKVDQKPASPASGRREP